MCQKRDFLELFDHIYFVVFKGLVIGLFFLTYKGERFFSSITHHDRYIFRVSLRSRRLEVKWAQEKTAREKKGLLRRLFQCRNFFRQVFPCKNFFSLEISLQDIFFLKSPIPPSKSGMVDPLVGSCSPLSSLTLSYIFVLHYILLHWRYIWRAFIFEKICITSKQ